MNERCLISASGKLRNENKITFATGAGLLPIFRRLSEKNLLDCPGFLFIFKARYQTHSELRNCLGDAEDGQKDKSVSEVINSATVTARSINRQGWFTKKFQRSRTATHKMIQLSDLITVADALYEQSGLEKAVLIWSIGKVTLFTVRQTKKSISCFDSDKCTGGFFQSSS